MVKRKTMARTWGAIAAALMLLAAAQSPAIAGEPTHDTAKIAPNEEVQTGDSAGKISSLGPSCQHQRTAGEATDSGRSAARQVSMVNSGCVSPPPPPPPPPAPVPYVEPIRQKEFTDFSTYYTDNGGQTIAWAQANHPWSFDAVAWRLSVTGSNNDPTTFLNLGSPEIDGCSTNNVIDPLNTSEVGFTPISDPSGSWLCQSTSRTGGNALDFYLGLTYQMWKWETPVYIDNDLGSLASATVVRGIDWEMADGVSTGIAERCGWDLAANNNLSTTGAIAACDNAAGQFTVDAVYAMRLSSDQAMTSFTFSQFESSMRPAAADIVFDPPSASAVIQNTPAIP